MSPPHPRIDGALLRSMLRDILRGLRKIRSEVPIVTQGPSSSVEFEREVLKASIDNGQYRDYLLSEIRHTVFQKFTWVPTSDRDIVSFSLLQQGHDLAQYLNAIKRDPKDPSSWRNLIDLVIEERSSQLKKSKWALDYRIHKKVIDEGHKKELHPLLAKRVSSKQKRSSAEIDITTKKGYKAKLEQSKDNSSWVVRNYLKRLQLTGKIPNPYKLPYVSESMHRQAMQLPKTVNIIPGSTKSSVLETAYDMRHIDSIIKPEIEYLLNKRHYVEAYERLINKKGPAQVRIGSTQAGIMQAHFLRSPIKDPKEMKIVAMDVKNLTRAIRKQFIWKLSPSQSEQLSERRFGEGYAVRGSKGFSMDEIMYPKLYYQDIVTQEAEWEFLIKVEEIKAKFGTKAIKDSRVLSQLDVVRQQNFESWITPLDIASKAIDDEVQLYFTKYEITGDSPIWKKRDELQKRLDKNYKVKSRRFERLTKLLKADYVCAHSNLFYRNKTPVSLSSDQMPELERQLAGKSLGDYLEQVGLKGFKMGYEFKKKLNIA